VTELQRFFEIVNGQAPEYAHWLSTSDRPRRPPCPRIRINPNRSKSRPRICRCTARCRRPAVGAAPARLPRRGLRRQGDLPYCGAKYVFTGELPKGHH
jgi:hypothetical protein